MRMCCPEKMNARKSSSRWKIPLSSRCKIGGRDCEVPGFESVDSYSQHAVRHPYRNWDQRDSYEYSASLGPLEEHAPSQQGNNADPATSSQQGNVTALPYYGSSLLQASRQRFDDVADSSNNNDSLVEEAPRMAGLQASNQCVHDDDRKDTDYANYGPALPDDHLMASLLQGSRQRLNESMDSNDEMEAGEVSEVDLKASEHRVDDSTDTGLKKTQEAVVRYPKAHPGAGIAIKSEDTPTKVRSPRAHPGAGIAIKIEDTPTKYPLAAATSPFQAWNLNVSSVRIKMEDTHPHMATSSSSTHETPATHDTDDAAAQEVEKWLDKKVSHWSAMWKTKYAKSLVDYGFDSAAILDQDLRVENVENIMTEGVGMKRGHALSLRHALEDGR
jgi:hypothetical protein